MSTDAPPSDLAASRGGATWRRAALAGVLALAASLGACDPCDDPTGCTVEPTLSYTGQLVEHTTGRAVAGARVQLVRTSGVSLGADTLTATTDSHGFYQLRASATASGQLVGDVVVTPPGGLPPYRVNGLQLDVGRRRGEGGLLGRWVVDPYIIFIGELHRRGANAPLKEAHVTFVRTGGMALQIPRIVTATDTFGRFELRPGATGLGDAVGDLVVESAQLPRPVRIQNVRLTSEYRDVPPQVGGSWTVGPSFRYVGEVYERISERRLANVEVEFVRTGGAQLDAADFVVKSDATGRFPLLLSPLDGQDTVIGDLTFRVPGHTRAYVYRGVRFPVFDTDEVRLLRVFGVGPALLYVGEAFHRGSRRPTKDVEYSFERTGGIPVTPAQLSGKTDTSGRFPLVMLPGADTGEVVGTLTLRIPSLAPEVYPGVRLRVTEDDTVRLARTWGVGEQLSFAGVLFLRSTGRPPPQGVEVEFRRTGGIHVTPDTFVVRSNDFGGFPLSPATAEVGEVVGDLIFRPPAPLHEEVRHGVRLRTFAADELRRLDNYGIGPSLQYFGEVLGASDGRPIAGASVEFRRTGGIAVTPEVVTRQSNQDGRFLINPGTSEYGELIGTVTIRVPSGREYRFENVRLATFETDEFRLLQSWRVEP